MFTDTGLSEATIYYYRVAGTNSTNSSAYSDAVHAVTWRKPVISTVLQPKSVAVGQGVSFSVVTTGTAPLTYQWQMDGADLAGEDGEVLTIVSAVVADDGEYRVVVTNSVGSTNSNLVKVTVIPVYTLTVNRTAVGGTVVVDKDTAVYIAGSSVKLTATAKAGYRFAGWDGDTTTTVNPLLVTMQKNRTITATYKKTYKLTVTSSDGTKGTVALVNGTSPITVDSGVVVGITASPKSGFKFKQWSSATTSITLGNAIDTVTTVVLRGGDATVQGEFRCITFKKQLNFNQYTDMVLVDAVQTSDGGYLVVGRTNALEGTLIIRLNQQGDTVLTQVDTWMVRCRSIRMIPGGYIASGEYSGSAVAYCLAQNGNSLWGISLASIGKNLFAEVTVATNDGGYIMGAGDGDGFYHILKTDALRIGVWDTTYDVWVGSMSDCMSTRDGGYIFVGGSTYDMQPKAIKTDGSGAMQWNSTFASAIPDYTPNTIFNSLDSTGDGEFVLAGSGNQNSVPHGFILKVASDGTYGDGITIDGASRINAIRVLKNGDYMIAGGTVALGSAGGENIYIARSNSTGIVLTYGVYGGSADEQAFSLQLTSDGGAIAVGTGNWVIKTDEDGKAD